MDSFAFSFKEWLNEDNNLFWIGPLLNDPEEGIVTLSHKLKNKINSSNHVTDAFLWDKWKKFYGALDNIHRISGMGDKNGVLNLIANIRKYFQEICHYYQKIAHYRGSPEEFKIKQHLNDAIAQLSS